MSSKKNNQLKMIVTILVLNCAFDVIIGKNLINKNVENSDEDKILINLFKKNLIYDDSKDLLVESFLETYQLLKDPQLTYFQRFKITQYLQKITLELKKYINGKEKDFYTEILTRGYKPTKEKYDGSDRQPFKWGR